MDPQDAAVLIHFVEVEMEKKREKLRLMEESIGVARTELTAKEKERSLLVVLADEEARENLVADFLEADGNLNKFDANTMMGVIADLISPDALGGEDSGGFGCDYEMSINYLADTQNLDKDGAVMTTIEGTKVDGDPDKDGAVMATIEGTKVDGDPDKDGALTATVGGTKVDPVELTGSETGVDINCLANTQNQDKDGAMMGTIQGTKVDGDPDKDGAMTATIGGTKVDGGAVAATVDGTKVEGE